MKHTQDFSGQTSAIIAPFSAPGRTWSIPGPCHLWASRPMPPLGVSTVRPAQGAARWMMASHRQKLDGFTPPKMEESNPTKVVVDYMSIFLRSCYATMICKLVNDPVSNHLGLSKNRAYNLNLPLLTRWSSWVIFSVLFGAALLLLAVTGGLKFWLNILILSLSLSISIFIYIYIYNISIYLSVCPSI